MPYAAARVLRPPPQVAQYESNGATGALHPGCPMVLSSDSKRHGDAREGPLNPGKVGLVVEHRTWDTVSRVKVRRCVPCGWDAVLCRGWRHPQ